MARSLGTLTRQQVVDRARSAIGKTTVYALGEGGRDPNASSPGSRCDCSGFAAWVLGRDRYLPNAVIEALPEFEKWIETSSLYADARSPWGFVAEVPWTNALPGDLVVWPDHAGHQGHVGVVSEVDVAGPLHVVHCSTGNFKATGDAIAETLSTIFQRNAAIVARVRWVA